MTLKGKGKGGGEESHMTLKGKGKGGGEEGTHISQMTLTTLKGEGKGEGGRRRIEEGSGLLSSKSAAPLFLERQADNTVTSLHNTSHTHSMFNEPYRP